MKVETLDLNNNPISTVGEYVYDGDGKRIKKHVPSTGEVTVFVYDAAGKTVAEYSTQISEDPKVSYATSDHLGSPRILTDENGSVISRRDFHPFGEETFTPQRVQGLGYQPDDVRQKFTGYERDAETDLDFAVARYYSKNLGRFNSSDPVRMLGARMADPQHWNLYVYARNNPLLLIDINGEFPYTFHIRSFAPPKSFRGLGFNDDNRGYSVDTSTDTKSRIKQSFTLDTVTESLSGGRPTSDATRFSGLGDTLSREATAVPVGDARIDSVGRDPSTNFLIKSFYQGNNPLVPGSGNIDVQAQIGVIEDREKGEVIQKETRCFLSEEQLMVML